MLIIWKEERIPIDWESATIKPILSNRDDINCNNEKGIFLLVVIYKILETPIGEFQAGLCKKMAEQIKFLQL